MQAGKRSELEQAAAEIEERLHTAVRDPQTRRFLEGHAFGIRRALCITADAVLLDVHWEVRAHRLRWASPADEQVTVGEVAHRVHAEFGGAAATTRALTLGWGDWLLDPDTMLGSFGLEDGDEVQLVTAPNVDFPMPRMAKADRLAAASRN